MIKIVRLTSLPLVMSGLRSPEPRLRHGRRHACFCLLNLILNQSILSSVLLLALLPPVLTSPTVLPQGVGMALRRQPEILLFCLPTQDLAQQSQRLLVQALPSHVPRGVYFSFSCPFSILNFSRLPQTSPRPLPLARTKLPISC